MSNPQTIALVRVGCELAEKAFEARQVPVKSSVRYLSASDRHARDLGYRDGQHVDPHGGRSSRLLT